MVWAAPEPVDDAAPGIDSVRAKPLKKRCSARAGLSRYYSSKSQSFSSLELAQSTPFGTSALALAKRPSSFDLHRASPRAVASGLRHAPSSGLRSACDAAASYRNAANQDDDEEEEQDGHDSPDRCPCNDTIFADPSEAFMSPEGSPSASQMQLHDSCNLTGAGLVPYQQQRQYQLTTEYLTHLSVLLPMQHSTAASGGGSAGGLGHAFSGGCRSASSCGSGCFGHQAGSSGNSSCCAAVPCADSAIAAAARGWQPAGAHLAVSCGGNSGGGGGCEGADRGCLATDAHGRVAASRQHHAASGTAAELEAASRALLQSCSGDLRTRVDIAAAAGGGDGGSNAAQTFACQNASATAGSASISTGGGGGLYCSSSSRQRNCLSAGGGGFLAPSSSWGGSFPAAGGARGPAVVGATMAALQTSAPSWTGAAGDGSGGGGSSSLGRKAAHPHRRLHATHAAGSVGGCGRHAAAGPCGVAAEEMIASLSLGERRQPQQRQQQQQEQVAGCWAVGACGGSSERPGLSGVLGAAATSAAGAGDGSCCQPMQQQQQHHHHLHFLQNVQQQQQWLCGSAPSAPFTSFGRSSGGDGGCF